MPMGALNREQRDVVEARTFGKRLEVVHAG